MQGRANTQSQIEPDSLSMANQLKAQSGIAAPRAEAMILCDRREVPHSRRVVCRIDPRARHSPDEQGRPMVSLAGATHVQPRSERRTDLPKYRLPSIAKSERRRRVAEQRSKEREIHLTHPYAWACLNNRL